MSWSGGTSICVDIWEEIRDYIPDYEKVKVLKIIINILRDRDWDNLGELEYEMEYKEVKEAIKLVYGDEE